MCQTSFSTKRLPLKLVVQCFWPQLHLLGIHESLQFASFLDFDLTFDNIFVVGGISVDVIFWSAVRRLPAARVSHSHLHAWLRLRDFSCLLHLCSHLDLYRLVACVHTLSITLECIFIMCGIILDHNHAVWSEMEWEHGSTASGFNSYVTWCWKKCRCALRHHSGGHLSEERRRLPVDRDCVGTPS